MDVAACADCHTSDRRKIYRMMPIAIKKEIRNVGIPLENQRIVDNRHTTMQYFKAYTEQVHSDHHQNSPQHRLTLWALLD